ncbi:hypothetical protein DET54_112132 [Paenibacillus pabuli]|uniref:Uncharacterized protein n=1 Tax=Paenibacillus pabuli TaxID=1472 RepID=A0ABX9BG25_9BACL|nr:hypothetical protein [Paenibacillus pabuli]RAI91267.1 hypothetical protein DET54_112132 [Paenibacillus pabuli]
MNGDSSELPAILTLLTEMQRQLNLLSPNPGVLVSADGDVWMEPQP